MRGIMADPCRPVWLGRRDDQVVLGLPGSPVSAAVGFHVIGREAPGAAGGVATTRRSRDVPSHGDRVDLPRCAIRPRRPPGAPCPNRGRTRSPPLCGADALAWIPASERRARGRARRVRAALPR